MTYWKLGAGATGAHALVIGVGDYPALVGGASPLYPQHGGMGQLTSAPVSAIAFADWLTAGPPTGYDSSQAPLLSLELLISAATPQVYQPWQGGLHHQKAVDRADFVNIQRAIQDWFARLNTSPSNR